MKSVSMTEQLNVMHRMFLPSSMTSAMQRKCMLLLAEPRQDAGTLAQSLVPLAGEKGPESSQKEVLPVVRSKAA
jgi:hypothetical protein